MIGVVARLVVKSGANAAFEDVMGQLARKIRSEEPGNLLYKVCRSRSDPQHYVVMELYASAEAFEAHGTSLHVKEAGGLAAPLLDGRPDIEQYDAVAD